LLVPSRTCSGRGESAVIAEKAAAAAAAAAKPFLPSHLGLDLLADEPLTGLCAWWAATAGRPARLAGLHSWQAEGAHRPVRMAGRHGSGLHGWWVRAASRPALLSAAGGRRAAADAHGPGHLRPEPLRLYVSRAAKLVAIA
jgi:hypothetical protein